MTNLKRAASTTFLRWTLGLVVLWESFQFAISNAAIRHLHAMGLPGWVAPVLGGVEIVAVLLFLIPKLRGVGGYALLSVFVVAAVLHVLHGQFEIGSLAVYSAVVFVCMGDKAEDRKEALS